MMVSTRTERTLSCRICAEAPDISWVNIQVVALRHNREGEVVAGAAFVVDLEVIAVAGKGRAVGQVTEGAHNGRRRGVVNHSKNCARRQRAGREKIAEDKLRNAVNPHTLVGNWTRCK